MILSPDRKAYKGILQIRGGSIKDHGRNSRKYSTIRIGQHELHDIAVPEDFEKLLVQGKEIELTLNSPSFAAFVLMVASGLLVFTGELSDSDSWLVPGIILFFSSMAYWITSLINAGHEVYSIKSGDMLHRNTTDFQYEELPSHISDPLAGNRQDAMPPGLTNPVAHKEPAPSAVDLPESHPASLPEVEKQAFFPEIKKPDGAAEPIPKLDKSTFNTHIMGVTRLICPSCASEALVMPETNVICGNCKIWMQADKA